MGRELVIESSVPNGFRIPGVLSGMRVFLSSDNHIGVTSGRLISADGYLIEMPRIVSDVAELPSNEDVVILTASYKSGGICFKLKSLCIIDNDEIAVAMIKVLKNPAVSKSDILLTHALGSSNFVCMKSISFSASPDNRSRVFDLPLRITNDHRIHVKVGSVEKKIISDYKVVNATREDGYKFTSIEFVNPPVGPRKVHVEISLNE